MPQSREAAGGIVPVIVEILHFPILRSIKNPTENGRIF
jgi:hypothetical protein